MKLIHGRSIALCPDFVEPRFYKWLNKAFWTSSLIAEWGKILAVWFSSQWWFNKAPPAVGSAGSMAALGRMFHYTVHCRSWTLLLAGLALSRDTEQLLCHWWEQSFVFSRQGRPRIIRKFGEWRISMLGAAHALEKRNPGYPKPWGNERGNEGRHFLQNCQFKHLLRWQCNS